METFSKDGKDPGGKFCLMPWIHLHMDTGGKVKACCSTSITYGQLGDRSDQETLEKVWNGHSAKAFRKKLLSGGFDPRCNICFKREAAGKSSMRTETLSKYEGYRELAEANTDEGGNTKLRPVYLDLRFSNICNLKCRTCWHGASSSWFEDAKILNNQAGEQAIIRATTNNPKVLKEILNYADNISEVYFAGGEPLMMEEHYQLLEWLLKNGHSSTVLRYNTNLTMLHYKSFDLLAIWKEFPNVHLSVSIDATDRAGEYIRSGLRWEKFVLNFKRIRQSLPHVRMEIAPTVSTLNIFNLPELHRYFVTNKLLQVNDIYINLLDRPFEYNIAAMPEEFKKLAEEKITAHLIWLKNKNASRFVQSEFKSILEFMNVNAFNQKADYFLTYNGRIDVMRKEKLREKLPDLHHALLVSKKKY